ncbi:MAG TPA: response regulator [Methylomirabilota bacterium]|nr:response regulator [Methylomirabilota bacterium]
MLKTTILNVNDDGPRRYVIGRTLRSAGLQVIEAETGHEALERVAAEKPAVVILDVKLPDLSGFEVCRRIKTDAATASTLVLLLSAVLTEDADKVHGLEHGADAYLTEPFDASVFTATVKALLRIGQAEAALRESELSHRLLFESHPLPAWVLDVETLAIIAVNDAAVQHYGYSRGEFLAMSLKDLLIPQDPPISSAKLAGRARGLDDVGVGHCVKRDGAVVEVEVKTRGLTFAGGPARLVVADDITERRRLEAERVELLARNRAEEAARALVEIGRQLMTTFDLGEMTDLIVSALLGVFRVRRAALFVLDAASETLTCMAGAGEGDPAKWVGRVVRLGDGLAGRAAAERRPMWSADLFDDPQFTFPESALAHVLEPDCRAWACVPLVAQEEGLGALTLGDTTGRMFREDEMQLLAAFAGQAALALRNARLYEEVRSSRERLHVLSRRLLEVQEAEHRYLARELHDEMGQALSAVKIDLETLRSLPDAGALTPSLEESIALVERLLQQIRNLSLDLRPSLLDDFGLVAALRWYVDRQARRAGFTASVECDVGERRFRPEVETACFRVAQAAVTNVVRHARAQHLTVELRHRDAGLELVVRDDGAGFDTRAAREGARRGESLGLLAMEERVFLLDGSIAIESVPGHGTEVRARFPLRTATS